MGVVIEGTGDQHIEVGVRCLPGGLYKIGARDRPEFRPDEDTCPFLRAVTGLPFGVRSLGADEITGPGSHPGERYAVLFMRLLDARGLEIIKDYAGEVLLLSVAELPFGNVVD